MSQTLDDDHTAGQQNRVDGRQFFAAVDIGHRGRFDAQDADPSLDTPTGQFQTDPRQLVPIGRLAVPLASVRPQQQPVPRANL